MCELVSASEVLELELPVTQRPFSNVDGDPYANYAEYMRVSDVADRTGAECAQRGGCLYERGRVYMTCTLIISGSFGVISGADRVHCDVGTFQLLAESALDSVQGKYRADFCAQKSSSAARILRICRDDFIKIRDGKWKPSVLSVSPPRSAEASSKVAKWKSPLPRLDQEDDLVVVDRKESGSFMLHPREDVVGWERKRRKGSANSTHLPSSEPTSQAAPASSSSVKLDVS